MVIFPRDVGGACLIFLRHQNDEGVFVGDPPFTNVLFVPFGSLVLLLRAELRVCREILAHCFS